MPLCTSVAIAITGKRNERSGSIRAVFKGSSLEKSNMLPDKAEDGLVGGDRKSASPWSSAGAETQRSQETSLIEGMMVKTRLVMPLTRHLRTREKAWSSICSVSSMIWWVGRSYRSRATWQRLPASFSVFALSSAHSCLPHQPLSSPSQTVGLSLLRFASWYQQSQINGWFLSRTLETDWI